MASDLASLTASEMLAALARHRVTSQRLVEASLAAIVRRDRSLKSFVRLSPEARAEAARSDRRGVRRPLEGVPVGVKDIIDTARLGTEYGARIAAGHVPAHDATAVHRLREAGAVVVGKCATTEFAHMHPAATRNPHDPTRTPGGSSSGSAAAVAAGLVPLALGTQTGGSVIRPGSFCGVFAFKSSWGRTETHGIHELGRSLDTVGWFARSAEDLGLLGPVLLAGHQPARTVTKPSFVRLRTPYDALASKAMLAACDDVAARLAAAGAEVARRRLPAWYKSARDAHRVVISVEASRAFARYAREQPTRLSATLRDFIEKGQAAEPDYAGALAFGDRARVHLDQVFGDHDVLIVPAAAGEAPKGLGWTGDPVFNGFWSLLRVPCVSLPAARSRAGMPLGVQLVGRFGQDERLLAIASWVAERLKIGPVAPV
ncbi:MAG: amidase [Alphaproteobacteria bacterium]|nr:amidase [Alphaproteobacteria bacterium]